MRIESAQHLWALNTALDAFASQRVPFGIMLKIRPWRNEVSAIHEALNQDLQPLLEEAGGSMGPASDGWQDFVEAAEDLFEPTEVDLEPIPLGDLQGLTQRDDFAMSTGLFEVLIVAGVIQE